MTSKTLEKLYPQLKPAERHIAMLAAHQRGDDIEAERLKSTAPRIVVTLPDYHTLAEAFLIMLIFEQAEILSLIGWYGRLKAGALSAILSDEEVAKRDDDYEFAANAAETYAWRIVLEEAAWREFWEGMGLDRDPLAGMPGEEIRAIMLRYATKEAPSTEQLAERLGKPVGELLTVEKRLESLRNEFEHWRNTLGPA